MQAPSRVSSPPFALEMGFSAAKSRLTLIARADGEISEGFHPPPSSAKVFRQSGAAQMRHSMNRFRGICAVRVQNAPESARRADAFFSRTHRQSHRRLHGNRPQSISSRRLSSKVHRLRTPAALPQEACSRRVQRKQAAFRPKSVLYQKDRSLRHGGLRSFFDVCQRTSSSGSTHSLAR